MLLTRAPLYLPLRAFAYDLHVLGMPPAFVLSQDQTLQANIRTAVLFVRLFVLNPLHSSGLGRLAIDSLTFYFIQLLHYSRQRFSCVDPLKLTGPSFLFSSWFITLARVEFLTHI